MARPRRKQRLDFTIRQLEVYAAVVRLGGVGAAARKLRISQPAVSSTVTQLELALGLPLLVHQGWKALPTPEGRKLAGCIARVLDALEQTRLMVADLRELHEGQLRLGAGPVIGTHIITPHLGAFQKIHPKVEITLRVENTKRLTDGLNDGDFDIIVLPEPVPDHFDSMLLHKSSIVILASPEHPLVAQRQLPLSFLSNETVLLREHEEWIRQQFDSMMSKANVTPKALIELGYNESIRNAVSNGLGIAPMSSTGVHSDLEEGRLRILSVDGFPVPVNTFLCWKKGQPSHLTDIFVSFMSHLSSQ